MSEAGMLDALCAHRVIPVVVLERSEDALHLAAALEEAGLPVAEVASRTAAAAKALQPIATGTELLVGAGTVVRPEQVDRALAAGARFVVTPGFSAAVVERCREVGLPILPGVQTASEVIAALDHGLGLLKFFLAEAAGGAAPPRSVRSQGPSRTCASSRRAASAR